MTPTPTVTSIDRVDPPPTTTRTKTPLAERQISVDLPIRYSAECADVASKVPGVSELEVREIFRVFVLEKIAASDLSVAKVMQMHLDKLRASLGG